MTQRRGTRRGQGALGRFADDANARFVHLARVLMRLVAWSDPARYVGRCRTSGSARCRKNEPPAGSCDSNREGVPSPETKCLNGSMDDGSLQARLKELFHQDALHRLAAARWIRQRGCASAIPVLEGVLPIEEDVEVRAEIEHALQVLTSFR